MAEYTVKTTDNRNLVIEADGFITYGEGWEFFGTSGSERKIVARIPFNPYVFAIVLNDNVKSDHYYVYDWNEEDEKEAEAEESCLDCQFQEFLESKEFFSEVWDILDLWHAPDGPEPLTLYRASHKESKGSPSWGFWYRDEEKGDVFVPFGSDKDTAIECLEKHEHGERGWSTWPLSETTPVPETIQ